MPWMFQLLCVGNTATLGLLCFKVFMAKSADDIHVAVLIRGGDCTSEWIDSA